MASTTKCCTKSRAEELFCNISGTFASNQLVTTTSLSAKPKGTITLNVNRISSSGATFAALITTNPMFPANVVVRTMGNPPLLVSYIGPIGSKVYCWANDTFTNWALVQNGIIAYENNPVTITAQSQLITMYI